MIPSGVCDGKVNDADADLIAFRLFLNGSNLMPSFLAECERECLQYRESQPFASREQKLSWWLSDTRGVPCVRLMMQTLEQGGSAAEKLTDRIRSCLETEAKRSTFFPKERDVSFIDRILSNFFSKV